MEIQITCAWLKTIETDIIIHINMSDKYKNGKIYTIRCKNDDTLIDIGSTIQPLFQRWYGHKIRVNNEKCDNFLYQKIRETNIEDCQLLSYRIIWGIYLRE
jgi:hypothetical protein